MSYLRQNRDNLRIRGRGLIAENYQSAGSTSASIGVSGTIYYALVGLHKGDIITNIHVVVSTAGSTSTSGFVALYDSAGNRLAVSADLTSTIDAAALKTLALSAPFTITVDGAYYLAILDISAVTMPTFVRGTSTANAMVAVGSGVRAVAVETGASTMPTTATFSNASFAIWMGAS